MTSGWAEQRSDEQVSRDMALYGLCQRCATARTVTWSSYKEINPRLGRVQGVELTMACPRCATEIEGRTVR